MHASFMVDGMEFVLLGSLALIAWTLGFRLPPPPAGPAPSYTLPGEWRSPEDIGREERARLRREAGIFAPTTQELRLLGGYEPVAAEPVPAPAPSEPVPIYTPPPPGGGGGGPIKPF